MEKKGEKRPIRVALAQPEDAAQLTVVQGRSFLDDRKWMPEDLMRAILAMEDPLDGPPGCTSVTWNRRVIENRKAIYYKVLLGERIVGGLFVFDRGGREWELGRIYVDPDYQDRGIGQKVVREMYRLHPEVVRWTLGTPEWATRNHHFYEKMGFRLTEITEVEEGTGWRSRTYENTLAAQERARL